MRSAGLDNQNGMVLIMVLLVLLASTLIGVASMRAATTDIRIVGNDGRFSQNLYQAEANINTAIWETKLWVDEPANYVSTKIPAKHPVTRAVNTVEIISDGRGQPPLGSGYSVTAFDAGYFKIKSTCGEAKVEAGAWMIAPKPN